MDIRVLRYFIIIAQELNISKAARLLHVSQPALSRQIAELETTLGTKLFIRGKRQLQLTPDGYYLLERAKEIVGLVNKTTYTLQKQDLISGTLDIGAGESTALQCVMETIKEIMHKYPEIHINFRSGDSENILSELDSGILEFGIIMGDRPLDNYHRLILPERNRWGVIMRKDEPLAKKDFIQPSDLLGRSLLLSRQVRRKQLFQDWSQDLWDQLNFVGTYNLIFNAALLVQTGACMALSYEGLTDMTNNDVAFIPLQPELTDPNTLIWSKNRQMPETAKLFLQTLKENLKETK
ncbi:LysR family transcriptional regulator [Companilactobacillus sp. HBUAS59544]|uniref:LysR family transcriptional regulator n=1 Tax=Companilactobacillus sp. HBUAS59544 TaxID=3109363 RepID=UPI002FEEE7FD